MQILQHNCNYSQAICKVSFEGTKKVDVDIVFL